MQNSLMKISDIKANPNNPRIIKDDKFKKLVESVKNFPEMLELRPIVVNKDMIILGGNMRFKACKEAWIKEIPVIVADNLTEDQEREFLIKDNVSGGEWDWDILANEWDKEELEEWGLDVTFDTVEPEAVEDDFEVDEGIKTDIVLGDLFEIWPHRLLCWDSTNIDDVNKLMNGEKADMVFTDPPYWINVVQGWSVLWDKWFWKVGGRKIAEAKEYEKIIWDDTTDTAKEFYYTCIALGMENFIIWGWNYFTEFLPASMCWIVWDKENTWNFADVELAWTSFNKWAKLYKWLWNWMSRKWERAIEGKTRVHPTQKPVWLFNDIFRDFEFKSCFDWFGGSGSTMAACHQVNKKCFMVEMSPNYVQTIINRMLKLDPTLEIKRNWLIYNPVNAG